MGLSILHRVLLEYLCIMIFFIHAQFITSLSLSSSSFSQVEVLCPHEQSTALLQFKKTFSIDDALNCDPEGNMSYPKTNSWKEGVDCCLWDGVTCDDGETGDVVGLDVSCSCLRGTIHSNNSLFQLSQLQRLNLAYNDFEQSQISPKFGEFSYLTHLNLSSSMLSGKLPFGLSHLSRLVSLDLSENDDLKLQTSMLKSLARNLTHLERLFLNGIDMSLLSPYNFLMNLSLSLTSLDLANTNMFGNFPVAYIFRLPYLQYLNLNSNLNLTGFLPESNWTTSLKFLDLGFCSFTGLLPPSIGNLTLITHIDLLSNHFSGEIPSSFSKLTKLEYLDLGLCSFTGLLPTSIGNLTLITHIDLLSNHFSGEIPSSFSKLTKLEYLSLEDNKFQGRIPNVFEKMSKLTYISLVRNKFTGQLPSSVFDLPLVSSMFFQHNLFVGPFPKFARGLSKLNWLDLSSNFLNGTIPPWLFSLPSLQYLYLQNNHLDGKLSEITSNSFERMDLSGNRLSGSIPRSIFELENMIDLRLSSNNLSGSMEIEVLFSKLKSIELLDLSHNNLSLSTTNNVNFTCPKLATLALSSCNIKELPHVLKAFENIQNLDLSHNQIHGDVPQWFFEVGVDSLETLSLSSNNLTKIQKFPRKNIKKIDLEENLLEGELPIPPLSTDFFSVSKNKFTGEVPSTICHVKSLEVLDLSRNSLTGKIPRCLGNFSKNLMDLNLKMNSFQGTIPEAFGNKLRSLNFNGNKLGGPLPRSLLNCTDLEVLDFGNNKIEDTFPHWLASLPKLQVLVLKSNKFHGFVRGNSNKAHIVFPKLKIFDLSRNNFSGHFPTGYVKNFKAMMNISESSADQKYIGEEGTSYRDSLVVTIKGSTYDLGKIFVRWTIIDLSYNKFQGKIPKVIGKLNSLKGLNLSHNAFIGHIPPSIGHLINLEWLDLSSNNLTGVIPMELTSLTFLSFLNLSWNHLMGHIPEGKQFYTFPSDSYEGNLDLCGFPLTKQCDGDEAGLQPPPPLTMFQREDELKHQSVFNWLAISLGYTCGIVFGLVMGYFVFYTTKPLWLI